jgi:hypothetical protein
MIKPTLKLDNFEQVLKANLNGTLKSDVIFVQKALSEGYIAFNCANAPVYSEGKLSLLLDLIDKNLIEQFKHELVDSLIWSLESTINIGKAGPFIRASEQAPAVSSVLEEYALRSPTPRKTVGTYFKSLAEDNMDKLEPEISSFVDKLLECKGWANTIPNSLIAKLSDSVLPVLLLSNRKFLAGQSLEFGIRNIMGGLNVLRGVKKKSSANPFLGEAREINWLCFEDAEIRRRMESIIRNVFLSIYKLGATNLLWLLPKKFDVRWQTRFILGDFTDVIKSATTHNQDSKDTNNRFFCQLFASSSFSSTKDLPVGIALLAREIVGNERRHSMKRVLEKTNYPANQSVVRVDVSSFPVSEQYVLNTQTYKLTKINSTDSDSTYKPLSDSWKFFIDTYIESSIAQLEQKTRLLISFLGWAIELKRLDSPWDVKPDDLIGNDKLGIASYESALNASTTKKAKKTKISAWSGIAKAYDLVVNTLNLKTDNIYKSPFKDLPPTKFRGKANVSKTHRARIAKPFIERMINILAAPCPKGIPQYTWAKQVSLDALNSGQGIRRTDHNTDNGVFCPSRAAALTLLLLIPLRGIQARWLDEGVYGESIFDLETNSFIPNPDHCDNVTCGGSKGVLQPSSHIFSSADMFELYINTNKTKMWEAGDNGYTIPWPYVVDAKTDEEKRLNLPYEVILQQYKWMREHSPNPSPIRFYDVTADRNRESGIEGCDTPLITPLFRDTNERITTQTGEFSHPPISTNKLNKLFDELCAETQKQLHEEGFKEVKLVDEEGKSLFDLHSLRVAGISTLLESGVPIHIVQEFIAGHSAPAMTLHYLKAVSASVREKLVTANSESGMNVFVDNLEDVILVQPLAANKQDKELIKNKNFATFAPVEGGLCPLGGKGCAGCQNGMAKEMPSKTTDGVCIEFVAVEGGCGNCRYWITGPDFLAEQVLELNNLMLEMREHASDISQLKAVKVGLEFDIDDCESDTERKKVAMKLANVQNNIASAEEQLVPMMSAWSNRYVAIQQSQSESSSNNQVTLLGGDLNTSLQEVSQFELVRNVVEQARYLPRDVTPIPSTPARMLREFMDTILANMNSKELFARVPDKIAATHGASKLANQFAEMLSDKEINSLITGENITLSSDKKSLMSNQALKVIQACIDGPEKLKQLELDYA